MAPVEAAAVISGVGLVLSWGGAVWISGYRWGSVDVRMSILEKSAAGAATREQLDNVRQDVAEIKGMFRLTFKGPPDRG